MANTIIGIYFPDNTREMEQALGLPPQNITQLARAAVNEYTERLTTMYHELKEVQQNVEQLQASPAPVAGGTAHPEAQERAAR